MEEFYGTKLVAAKPMNRKDYNDYRGWELPSDENGADEGYLVEYKDGGTPNHADHEGYISWSPKGQFDAAYQPLHALSFGHALVALKGGRRVARLGWNGAGMFLYYVGAGVYAAQTDVAKAFFGERVPYKPYIAIKTVEGDVVPWVASQTDLLANDWTIVE